MKISITPKRQSLRIIWKAVNVDSRDMTRNDSPGPVARGVTVFGVLLLVAWSAFGADVKISDLPETNAPSASAVLPIVDNGVTWKVTKQNLLGPSVMVNVPGFLTNNLVGLDPSDPHSSGSPGTNSIQIINEMYAYDTNNASGNGLIRIDNGYGDFPAFGGNNNFNIMIGVDILHGGGYTNIMDFTLIGDDPLYGSTPQNSSDVIAIGDSPLNGAVVTNWNHAIVIGENPLSGSTLANGSGIIAIGKRAGYGKDYTGKSHMVMIGDNANSTNSNDFVFGDNAYNYFFPGASARFDGPVTAQGTVTAPAFNGNKMSSGQFQLYEAALTPADAGVTLDFSATNALSITLTGNVTFAFSNLATNRTFTLNVVGCSTNSTITWPAGCHGQPPAICEANKWVQVTGVCKIADANHPVIAALPDL